MENSNHHHLQVMQSYAIEIPAINWITFNWFKAIWSSYSIINAVIGAALSYLTYVGITEYLKTLPVNQLEVWFKGDAPAASPV
jgi:hypothetical protein